jgi:hypothetical protein
MNTSEIFIIHAGFLGAPRIFSPPILSGILEKKLKKKKKEKKKKIQMGLQAPSCIGPINAT